MIFSMNLCCAPLSSMLPVDRANENGTTPPNTLSLTIP